MPDIRLISPLLENFSVGDSLTSHNGVTCFPALEKETGTRYIVKVISIPESTLQLDAFLISGVYPNREAALNYFKGLANGVLHEAEALNHLAKLDGFLPIAGKQAELTENYSGYAVYLLSKYRTSLRRLMRGKAMTHLGAMNMALDLCAALVTARNSGCLYVDLKPENVFLDEDGHYKIGDIGFVPISCLKYATLENRYRSAFTPPEVSDPYAPLSDNMDVYALGRILHCLFHTGNSEDVTAEPVPESPAFADEELSAIIMKACAVNPADRFSSPKEMGQALIAYMQKNTVNDARIIPEEKPVPVVEAAEETVSEEMTEEITEEVLSEEVIEEVAEEAVSEEVTEEVAEEVVSEVLPEEVAEEVVSEELPEEVAEEVVSEELAEEVTEEALLTDILADILGEDIPDEQEVSEETVIEIEDVPAVPESLEAEIVIPSDDFEAPSEPEVTDFEPAMPEETEADTEISLPETEPEVPTASEFELPDIFSDDVPDDQFIDIEDILTRADTEIYHEILSSDSSLSDESTVEVPSASENGADDLSDTTSDMAEDDTLSPLSIPTVIPETKPSSMPRRRPRDNTKIKRARATVKWILTTAAVCIGLFCGYRFYYLQNIDNITVNVGSDYAEVLLTTNISPSNLQVVCSDPYGNAVTSDVFYNIAKFTELKPGIQYQAKAVIKGFHKLVGPSSITFSTPVSAEITDLTVLNSAEEGTAVVSFQVSGKDSANWNLAVIGESGDHRLVSFTGHSVEVPDLTLGESYTFELSADDALLLSGTTSVTFVPTPQIVAENVSATYRNGAIQVRWNAPAGFENGPWVVACTDESGNTVSQSVDSCSAVINGVTEKSLYSISITAQNMSHGVTLSVNTVSVQVQDLHVASASLSEIRLEWVNNQPDLPLTLVYTVDGLPFAQQVHGSSAVVTGILPGARYDFAFQTANGEISETYDSVTTEQSGSFSAYGTSRENIIIFMCEDPGRESWSRSDIPADGYTTTFTAEQKAAFLFYSKTDVEDSEDVVNVSFAVRNTDKQLVAFQVSPYVWSDMWHNNQFPVSLTCLPTEAGHYALDIYFNDSYVNTIYFDIV